VADPDDTGYPPELARLTPADPAAYHEIRYGPGTQRYGQLWPAVPGRDGAPVVVLIHGGYWRARYRLDLMHALAADLAGRGYVVWNLEYRRMDGPGGGWPGTFTDLATGVDALAGLAGRYRLDLGRVALVGHSAGGHLALWAAGPRRPAGAAVVRPGLVVSLAGVTDLAEAARLRLSDGAVYQLLGGGPEQVPDRYAQACPTRLLPLGVPQLVVHGSADTAVPYRLGTGYAAAARAAGDPVEFTGLPGVDHLELIDPASAAWSGVAGALARWSTPG